VCEVLERMTRGKDTPPFEDFDARLKRLRGEPERDAAGAESAEPPRMRLGNGLQAGIEVIAGVCGGALLGYGLDRWFETSPLLLIVCFVLGAAAGVLNAFKTLRRFMRAENGEGAVNAPHDADRPPPSRPGPGR
jgi:F0F1-type ATP synthase assembly protein I